MRLERSRTRPPSETGSPNGHSPDLPRPGCDREPETIEGASRLARLAFDDAQRAGDLASEALASERIHLALTLLHLPDDEHHGQRALESHLARRDLTGAARTQTNLGIAAYFESRWNDASEWYLASIESGQQAGSVVPAANAAFNSAEILADQGQWDRALELCDDALRNLDAVGYRPGRGAALLFSSAPAMRSGDLSAAADRLREARVIFEDLGMTELLADLTVREFELGLLEGGFDESQWSSADAEFGSNAPIRHRLLRVCGLGRYLNEHPGARETLADARGEAAPTDFEYALTLRASLLADPTHAETDDWRRQVHEIRSRLGIVRFPELIGARSSISSK